MCPDETNEHDASVVNEPTVTPPEPEPAGPEPALDPATRAGVRRRRFLKAAALGTAVGAILSFSREGAGLHFGPLSAYANDLSTSPCTANDVVIVGTGQVLNEPCTCTGATFNAQVQFLVRNNTNTNRYCVALHLPSVTVSGITIPAQDVILQDGAGSSVPPGDTLMTGTVSGFPCNASGVVCFGTAQTKHKCAPGECATVSWNTTPNAAGCTTPDQSPPGGQCRHQQVCVQPFGASLTCVSNCTPTCGGVATLRATVTAAPVTSGTPFTYQLTGSDGTSQSFGPTADTQHDFNVTVNQPNTTYTVQITDSRIPPGNCFRQAQTSLGVTPISVGLAASNFAGCQPASNKPRFTATVTAGTGCNYTWKVDGSTVQTGASNTFDYTSNPDNNNHTVEVTANCSGCSASASKTIKQCVETVVT